MTTAEETTYCVNVATGGNSDRVTEMVTPEMKQRWGPMCYLRGAISVMRDLDTYWARITLDGQVSQESPIWNLMVANGRSAGGRFDVAPRTTLQRSWPNSFPMLSRKITRKTPSPPTASKNGSTHWRIRLRCH